MEFRGRARSRPARGKCPKANAERPDSVCSPAPPRRSDRPIRQRWRLLLEATIGREHAEGLHSRPSTRVTITWRRRNHRIRRRPIACESSRRSGVQPFGMRSADACLEQLQIREVHAGSVCGHAAALVPAENAGKCGKAAPSRLFRIIFSL